VQIHSPSDYATVHEKFRKWDKFNEDMLESLFTDDRIAKEYSFWVGFGLGERTFEEQVAEHHSDVRKRLSRLESIKERLDLYDEPAHAIATARQRSHTPSSSRKVFVVHGRDDQSKEAVARTLERLNLEAVILHEQAAQGRTLIEKFEVHSDVAFAIVLLTPDDIGYPHDEPAKAQPRACQNVVLELGFFLGRLGRDKVCALKRGDVEAPSDIDGLEYIPMDDGGAWRFHMAGEIANVIDGVDLNNLRRGGS
jgi:predicted nucleotide-binding protein